MHQKNLQVLVTEIYKVKNGIASEIMENILELQNPSYKLISSCNQFRRKNIKTVNYGLQSVRYNEVILAFKTCQPRKKL